MAKNTQPTCVPLNRSRLAALKALSRAITEAVLQGDLDRAAQLLEQRQLALDHLDWRAASNDQLFHELQSLWAMERELLDFCRTWRDILQERLQSLNARHHLLQHYCPPVAEAQFVDLHK